MSKKNQRKTRHVIGHRHTGIVVNNLKGQLGFYRDLLGMEVYYSKVEKGSFLDKLLGEKGHEPLIYKMGYDGNTVVELLYFDEAQRCRAKNLFHTGITHIALTVRDIYSLYVAMQSKGVKFVASPQTSTDGTHRVCFCKDADGNYIELVEIINSL